MQDVVATVREDHGFTLFPPLAALLEQSFA
jgi:hypothetical protein